MLKRFSAGAACARLLTPAVAWLLLPGLLHAAEAPPAADARLASPFDRYQAWRDSDTADWRTANARVGEIGGWRTYLRESVASAGEAAEAGEAGDDGAHGGH